MNITNQSNPLPLSIQQENYEIAVAAGIPEIVAASIAAQSNLNFSNLERKSALHLIVSFGWWDKTAEGGEFWNMLEESTYEELANHGT